MDSTIVEKLGSPISACCYKANKGHNKEEQKTHIMENVGGEPHNKKENSVKRWSDIWECRRFTSKTNRFAKLSRMYIYDFDKSSLKTDWFKNHIHPEPQTLLVSSNPSLTQAVDLITITMCLRPNFKRAVLEDFFPSSLTLLYSFWVLWISVNGRDGFLKLRLPFTHLSTFQFVSELNSALVTLNEDIRTAKMSKLEACLHFVVNFYKLLRRDLFSNSPLDFTDDLEIILLVAFANHSGLKRRDSLLTNIDRFGWFLSKISDKNIFQQEELQSFTKRNYDIILQCAICLPVTWFKGKEFHKNCPLYCHNAEVQAVIEATLGSTAGKKDWKVLALSMKIISNLLKKRLRKDSFTDTCLGDSALSGRSVIDEKCQSATEQGIVEQLNPTVNDGFTARSSYSQTSLEKYTSETTDIYQDCNTVNNTRSAGSEVDSWFLQCPELHRHCESPIPNRSKHWPKLIKFYRRNEGFMYSLNEELILCQDLEENYIPLEFEDCKTGKTVGLESLFDTVKENGERPKLVLVTGVVGAGKTVMCQNVVFSWCHGLTVFQALPHDTIVPVFFRLSQLEQGKDLKMELLAFVHDLYVCKDKSLELTASAVRELGPNCVLILDGYTDVLEEVRSKIKMFLRNEKSDFTSPFFFSSILVTSRPTEDDQFLGLFEEHFAISKLSEFSARWVVQNSLGSINVETKVLSNTEKCSGTEPLHRTSSSDESRCDSLEDDASSVSSKDSEDNTSFTI